MEPPLVPVAMAALQAAYPDRAEAMLDEVARWKRVGEVMHGGGDWPCRFCHRDYSEVGHLVGIADGQVCRICVGSYVERIGEWMRSGRPDPHLLIADISRALKAANLESAEAVVRELERDLARDHPRPYEPGTCGACRVAKNVVKGDGLSLCLNCLLQVSGR